MVRVTEATSLFGKIICASLHTAITGEVEYNNGSL